MEERVTPAKQMKKLISLLREAQHIPFQRPALIGDFQTIVWDEEFIGWDQRLVGQFMDFAQHLDFYRPNIDEGELRGNLWSDALFDRMVNSFVERVTALGSNG